jgi:hypothetical protein
MQTHGFDPILVQAGFMLEKMTLVQVFFPISAFQS